MIRRNKNKEFRDDYYEDEEDKMMEEEKMKKEKSLRNLRKKSKEFD